MNYPLLVFFGSLVILWLSARLGFLLHSRQGNVDDNVRHDLDLIRTASFTLFGLIVGFTFSMATGRYDQRMNYEEAEANAIGTEYVRADLLPAADAVKVKQLLTDYVNQRILFYEARSARQLIPINARTVQLQTELWSAVQAPVQTQPTPVSALAVAGMNDVLNSQGYTQAAWWDRIPVEAWALMLAIGIGSNLLMGYGLRSSNRRTFLILALPLIASISFFLIADIDSPRGGVVRISPKNLISLSQSLQPADHR
ncbi:hypothetical protein [Terriglobus sp. TAA 43]|uniref:bestrophin-like domain n=1 Tax=Terriglobus sp. TAA 43 TaxID=278961 RepID=UPI0018DE8B12|nr:hypothetical protein [Terriglobus sp. TAA 43]